MAFTTTTLAAAMASTDTQINVTSATGFAANQYVLVDQEFLKIVSSYTSGTLIPVLRAQNGTVAIAHPKTANVVTDAISSTAASDWGNPNSSVITAYSLAARRRKIVSYSASGAISLPLAGEDIIAVLNGTSVLAMTIAAPTTDSDGCILYVVGNGAAAHTIQFTGGLSGAGTAYDVITVNATAPICVHAMAVNGLWMSMVGTPMAGTVTNITGTVG
jgi:hypothetical protein